MEHYHNVLCGYYLLLIDDERKRSSLNCGAPGKIAEQIGLLAISRGWDVYMAHGVRHSNPSQLKTIPMVTPHEERVHALYSLLLDRHGLGPDGKTK